MGSSGSGQMRFSRRCALSAAGASLATVATGAGLRPLSATAQTPTTSGSDRIANAIARIESEALALTAAGTIPGIAIAVVHAGEVVYKRGFGVRSIDGGEPVEPETVFQLASVSKSLAGTTAAAVVGDGAASWDDPIVTHLPGFRLSDPWVSEHVTIRDCFCHRTGMPGLAGDNLERLGFSRDEIIARMADLNLTGEFRRSYAYSNFGITLGGVAAAAGAGLPWEDLAAQRLYEPLGMTSTSSREADYFARANRAATHSRINGEWHAAYVTEPERQSPAGGVSSNVVDLARWMLMLLGRGELDGTRHIAADALNEVLTPHIVRGRQAMHDLPGFYGLGFNIDHDPDGRVTWNHGGAFSSGARTAFNVLPEVDAGIVVLTNGFPSGVPEALNASFAEIVRDGESTTDWVAFWNERYVELMASYTDEGAAYATPSADPEPPMPDTVTAYTGRYTNTYFGDVTIEASGSDLTLLIGPEPTRWPLIHWNRDIFLHEWNGEVPPIPSAATFAIGPDGQAVHVTLQCLDGYGQGIFTRSG